MVTVKELLGHKTINALAKLEEQYKPAETPD